MGSHYLHHIVFFHFLGFILCIIVVFTCTDAQIFVLQVEEVGDDVSAQEACQERGSHLASPDELQHAVAECSFTACARGWLTGSRVGIMECTTGRSKSRSMKTISVMVEKASATATHLDIFCVKDGDQPCGEPPIFSHATLQAPSGLGMGDELLYTCDPGHTLPKGHTAFSLLCNSCGEWYGQVQPCRKEDAELHIDYEHHFLGEGQLDYADLNQLEEEFEGLELDDQENFSQKREVGGVVGGMLTREVKIKDPNNREYHTLMMGTESPKSMHLPWFPSHLIQKTDKPNQQEHQGFLTEGDNYLEMKVPGSYIDNPNILNSNKNFHIDTSSHEHDNYTRKSVASTKETWQDSNPVHPIAAIEEDKAGGRSKELMEDQLLQIHTMDHMGVKQPEVSSHVVSTDLMQVVTWTANNHNTKAVSTLESGKTGENYVDSPGVAMLPSLWSIFSSTVSWQTTETRPSPTFEHLDPDNTSYPYKSTNKSITESTTLTGFYVEYLERNWTRPETAANAQPTVEWCKDQECHLNDRGTLVALVIVATGTLIAAIASGIWCFKKTQQKNQMTRESQSYPTQHIEMQQKV